MMRRLRILTLSLLALPGIVSAQSRIQGEVTFLTSQHVYVKFESTEGIAENDTLKLMKDGVLDLMRLQGDRRLHCRKSGQDPS